MSRLGSIAKKVTVVSDLMTARTKMSTDELCAKYPDGIHVNAVDKVASGSDRNYTVFTFTENQEVFCNGGTVMNKIVDAWIEQLGGSLTDVNNELKNDPPFLKFIKSTTKTGKNITKVIILD